MSDNKQAPDPTARLLTAWIALAFAVVGILGLTLVPGARVVWIVLLGFGILAVPQVIFWRDPTVKNAKSQGEDDRLNKRR